MDREVDFIMRETEIKNLQMVQSSLARSLIEWAVENKLAAKDWVQGGWTRSKDKIDLGWRIQGALQEIQ